MAFDDAPRQRQRQPEPSAFFVERCVRAIWRKARELLERGIVASREEADLAFVYAIGFAMYLGGPFFYAQQRGWEAS